MKLFFYLIVKETEKLKNIFLEAAMNYDQMSNSEKAKVNDNIRKQFDNIIHGNPPKTEQEKKIDKLAREELAKYRRKKKAFYANPIHWDNNKRRRHGLPVLRGSVNKYRLKEYPGFHPSVRLFCMMEDLFNEILITTMEDGFNSFVEVKDLAVGDANVFRVSKQENNDIRGDSMRCRDCPYGIEDFTLRTEMYESVYGEYPDEDRANESEQFVWCDKVGGKAYSLGHCSDWYEQDEEKHKNYSKKKRMNERERYLKHQNRLKYLERVSCGYPKSVTYEDEIWIQGLGYIENPKPYYKRWYRGKRSSYLKQQSNKAIRRYKGELHKGYQHIHKIYDFWWKFS